MAIRVVYRSCAPENMKARPQWYSKDLCLASFLRSVDHARAAGAEIDILWLNDGELPPRRLAVMRAHGEVIEVAMGANRPTYRRALLLPAQRHWPDGDLLYLVEDDYLHRLDALALLATAAVELAGVDVFSPFGDTPLDVASGPAPSAQRQAARRLGWPALPRSTGGQQWVRSLSTTSTYAARVAMVRRDQRLLRLVPFTGHNWDFSTSLTYQGEQPFAWGQVLGYLRPKGGARGLPVALARTAAATWANARSHRRADRRRVVAAAAPWLAAHADTGALDDGARTDGTDWAGEAAAVRAWAAEPHSAGGALLG